MHIEGNPGLKVSLQVWLALVWRGIFWGIIYAVPIVGGCIFLFAIAGIALGMEKEQVTGAAGLIGGGLSLVSGILAFRRVLKGVLGCTFSGYRLLLVKDSPR